MARRSWIAAVSMVALGCGTEVSTPDYEEETESSENAIQSSDDDFEVDFQGCSEIASIAVLPYAVARPLVPAEYELAGDGTIALLVVRIANCSNVVVDGDATGSGTVAQIGVTIVPPDGDGDINNYTVFYDTDGKDLAKALKKAGVNARYVKKLDYDLDLGAGTLAIDVPSPSKARYSVTTQVIAPTAAAVPFVANWWQLDGDGVTKMNTTLPAIQFSGADTTVNTKPGSQLDDILGATTFDSFPVLDSFNTFPAAHMVVDRRDD
jgi:hypothetical protein